jgi:integral membrane protein
MNRQFRTLGFIEATSLLVLLFIAMPLKYLANLPEAVRIVGSVHGALFVLYVCAGAILAERLHWSTKKLFLACLISSIPFGPFVFDKILFPPEACR